MNNTEKVLWILKRLGEAPFEMGVTELSKNIGSVKSGIYKIMTKLTEKGFVVQNPGNKKYHLGPAIYILGEVYNYNYGLWEIAKPVMESLVNLTEETASIAIKERNIYTLVYRIDSPHDLRLHGEIGKKYLINNAAMAKVLAAYDDPECIKKYVYSNKLEKKTSKTIVDPEKLLKEFEMIRGKGYAVSDEEGSLDSLGVAAPIYDKNMIVCASLGIGGPKARIGKKGLKNIIKLVVDGASQISKKLQ